jgi:hypothetical protein
MKFKLVCPQSFIGGMRYSSVVECLPSMNEVTGFNPQHHKKKSFIAIIYDYFQTKIAVLSSYKRDHMAHTA